MIPSILNSSILSYLDINLRAQSACDARVSVEYRSFPVRIASLSSAISPFNLAGSTASPITSISPIFSFFM